LARRVLGSPLVMAPATNTGQPRAVPAARSLIFGRDLQVDDRE
jgi:hypothetical protein